MNALKTLLEKEKEEFEKILPLIVEDYNNFIIEAGEIGELDIEEIVSERVKPLFTASHTRLIEEVIKVAEEMNKCWCGGGKHFMKSRVVVHRSDCALNNEGYYRALDSIINTLKEAL